MLCRHCGSRIPFIANVCPQCTRDLSYGKGDEPDFISMVIVAIILAFLWCHSTYCGG